jgi:hypothetical protein
VVQDQVAVQVNGKARGKVTVATDAAEDVATALQDPRGGGLRRERRCGRWSTWRSVAELGGHLGSSLIGGSERATALAGALLNQPRLGPSAFLVTGRPS